MDKIDLAKEFKDLYTAAKTPKKVKAGKANFLAIDGKGEPGGPAFAQAIQSLFTMTYTMKFGLKGTGTPDFSVCKLECLWFIDGDPHKVPQSEWRWKLMIRMPDFIVKKHIKETAAKIKAKMGIDVSGVSLAPFNEGTCVQMMHIGTYDKLGESYEKLGVFAAENGHIAGGAAHEIYISDPHRAAPEKLKTIVRLPVKKI